MTYVGVTLAVIVAVVAVWLAVRRTFGTLRAGDFFKVAIPRTVDKPLSMGTRLDCASALKKAGVPRAEIDRLLQGELDQQLVDLYWQHKDVPSAKVVS